MNNFYVYTLAYPDETVFYVGKGSNGRIDQHEAQAKRGVKSYKCNVIRQIWKDGGQVVKTKVQDSMTDEAAYLLEIDLIRMYGREHLTNLTNGGECGGTGRPRTGRNVLVVTFTLSIEVVEYLNQRKALDPTFRKSVFIEQAIQEKMERERTSQS